MKQAADAAGKLAPSTAPCHPQPGKRFMIIRTEQLPLQNGLLQTGFDTINSTFGAHEPIPTPPASSEKTGADPPMSQSEPAAKKRWSMFGKLMSFSSTTGPASTDVARRNSSTKDDLAEVRRATAAERSGSQPTHKISHSSHESDASSTGSMPVYEAAQYVFKFTLGSLPWNPNADMTDAASTMLSTLPRERSLCKPRLPAPAQARLGFRAASTGSLPETLLPPFTGLPHPDRMHSDTDLINGVRGTPPSVISETESDRETPTGKEGQSSNSAFNLPDIQRVTSDDDKMDLSFSSSVSNDSTIRLDVPPPASIPRGNRDNNNSYDRQLGVVHPIKPVGVFKDRATYSGRALAEWAIVVNECNSFIERRRDEGVFGLRNVEVPSLGVENLRRMG